MAVACVICSVASGCSLEPSAEIRLLHIIDLSEVSEAIVMSQLTPGQLCEIIVKDISSTAPHLQRPHASCLAFICPQVEVSERLPHLRSGIQFKFKFKWNSIEWTHIQPVRQLLQPVYCVFLMDPRD